MAWENVNDYKDVPTVSFGEDDGQLGEGERFTGYYKYSKTANTKYGEKQVHTFQTTSGDVQIWGTTVLNRLLSGVNPGTMTAITYTGPGKKERGKNPAKTFQLAQDKADTIFVDVPKVSFRNDEEDSIDNEEEEASGNEQNTANRARPAYSSTQSNKAVINKTTTGKDRVAEMLANRKSA